MRLPQSVTFRGQVHFINDDCCSDYCIGDLLHDLRLDQVQRFIEVCADA